MKNFNKTVIGAMLCLVLSWSGFAIAETPTKLKMAAILSVGPQEPWDGSFLDSWEKVRAEKPHGLEMNEIIFTEGIWGDLAIATMHLYARQKYDIIWIHAGYSDQVKKVMKKYPDTLFVVVGSGTEGLGGNQYWVYGRIYEPAYALGVLAGMSTKSNVIGAVGGFVADDVNDHINAFFEGAKSVNPNIKQLVAFIDSWWDPPMAFEASNAQIALGADHILMLAGAYDACKKHKIVCYSAYRDWYETHPDVIGGSTVVHWEPHIRWIIDEWYKVKTTGQPYNGNKEPKVFLAKDGGSSMSLGGFQHPPEAKAKAEEIMSKIMSGEFEVPLDVSKPKGN